MVTVPQERTEDYGGKQIRVAHLPPPQKSGAIAQNSGSEFNEGSGDNATARGTRLAAEV